MDSKSRVKAALRREPTDRVPVWMWFHPDTTSRLSEHLQVPATRIPDAMGDDIRQAWVSNNYAMEGIVHERDGDTHVDFWGIEWIKDGPYNQIKSSPLEGAGEEQVRRYQYPYHRISELLKNMEPVLASRHERFIGCDISPCLFEMICRIRGMEGALLDLAASPDMAETMLRQAASFSLELAQAACDRFPLDWLWTGDDVGGQEAMMMSPECWRAAIRPHLAEIFKVAKSRGLPIAHHSCGAIRPIIPDLIDIGLDVLNPIQCNCPGMDPVDLKREFGRDLCFMGGVDTQELLPRGSAEEVCTQTERLLEAMTAHGGGYILAASHAVPPETPIENILSMYKAAGVTEQEILDRAARIRDEESSVSS